MARGVLSGAIWGTVLSVGALGTMSVLETSEADRRDDLAEAIRALPEEAPAAEETVPDTKDPVTDAAEDGATADNASASDTENMVADVSAPEPEEAQPTSDEAPAPEVDTSEIDMTAVTEQGTESDPANIPATEDDVAVATDTPALDEPDAQQEDAPTAAEPAPAPETGDEIAALTTPETAESPSLEATPSASDKDTPSANAPSLNAPDSEVDLSVSTEPAPLPEPEVTPAEPDQPAPEEPQSETDTETASVESDAPADRPQVRQLVPSAPAEDATEDTETAALARPAIGRPASSLIDRDGDGSRLPTIGETEAPAENAAASAEADDARPPLQRYAADATVSDPNLPIMSIVLIDDATGPLGPDTLDNFPFPVTFAIDPASAGAAERMRAYRASGYEVATLVDLPNGAQPTDVEQLLAGAVVAVPESVALIEAPDSALQADRSTTEQATRFAAESGHGLVFLPNGLNTAEAIARRENVPTISVLRDFDGDGQDARTKRRFLDGAAFRARQDGQAVMLGRLTPDTVSALLLWSLQDRASSVSIVPVSAILLQDAEN